MNNNFNLLNEYKEKEIIYKEESDKINLDMIKLKLELKEEHQKYYLLIFLIFIVLAQFY